MAEDIVSITREFCSRIQNGRTIRSAFEHGMGEMRELDEEIGKRERGENAGADGIRGEAIDVTLCMLDIIFQDDPSTKEEIINMIARQKCEKWAEKYKDGPSQ